MREVVPRVERTGLDEGYLDFRGLAADYTRARAVAEAVQTSVRAATSLTCSLGVAPTKVVAKVASDRRKPGGVTVVPAGTEARFLAPFAVQGAGDRTARRAAPRRGRGDDCRRTRLALRPRSLRRAPGPRRPDAPRPRERDRPRGLEDSTERISISVEETFERDLHDRDLLHAELRRMADRLGAHLRRDGLSARTVTAKLRYGDFSIRSRSTSLDVGIDDAGRIGEARLRPARPRPPRSAWRCGWSVSASPASRIAGSSAWRSRAGLLAGAE